MAVQIFFIKKWIKNNLNNNFDSYSQNDTEWKKKVDEDNQYVINYTGPNIAKSLLYER